VRTCAPFQSDDLRELGRLLEQASAVVAMETIADGLADHAAIGMRHDVDNHIGPAVEMARWEAERGYRSTYFILPTAPYWAYKHELQAALEEIAGCGHEIGFHLNAITAAIQTGRDPFTILREQVEELRGYGYRVRGVVAHGDQACYRHGFVNDELFVESPRPDWGTATRTVGGVPLRPVPRGTFGFDYDPNQLSRGTYLSDSGGRWSQPFEQIAAERVGQLHMLVHPDWWGEAFAPVEAAA
jgi:hypothetical protein